MNLVLANLKAKLIQDLSLVNLETELFISNNAILLDL
jgi:hypothetical protein